MKLIIASHLGFCFGVRDAITLARQAVRQSPITVLGELVHNRAVLDSLETAGIATALSLEAVKTQTVMVTAHGASRQRITALKSSGLEVREATCPLVRFAHRSVQRLEREGYHPVVVGAAGHVEVRGLTEDLTAFDLVLTEADVETLKPRARFGVVSQTTQPVERVRRLVERLRARFPDSEVRWIDTVCQPTKDRQNAAARLAEECDAVVVVGGRGSNNTRELAATCLQSCARVHLVETSGEIREEWFFPDDVVGLTAGTSTPDSAILEVENRLRDIISTFEGVMECEKIAG